MLYIGVALIRGHAAYFFLMVVILTAARDGCGHSNSIDCLIFLKSATHNSCGRSVNSNVVLGIFLLHKEEAKCVRKFYRFYLVSCAHGPMCKHIA